MRPIRTLAVLAAVVALAVAASPAPAAAKGNKGNHVHGVIKSFDKAGKTITVTTGGHKNKKTGETTPVVEKTFKVTDATTFVKMEKGAETPTAATFDDLKEGKHVSITVNGDVAVEVKMGHHHHGKKKPAA